MANLTLDIEKIKKLKKELEALLSELEDEAIAEGISMRSEEYEQLVSMAKEKFLSKQGISVEEYEELVEELRSESSTGLSDTLRALRTPVKIPHIPTEEEIKQYAMQVLPAPQIIRNTEVIERTTREKPITQVTREIVRETVREVDKSALNTLQKDLITLQSAFGEVLKQQETGQDVEDELELLRKEVARLTRIVNSYPGAGGFLGIRLDGEGTMQSYVEFKAGSNITLTRDGKVVTVASSGGGAGVSVETPTGTVNGSNTDFTPSAEPTYVIADGITYFDGAGYTWNDPTVEMDIPPSQYIRVAI
jgi:hypothetical protein